MTQVFPDGYPVDVRFSRHYAILLIALRHEVASDPARVAEESARRGWRAHPCLHDVRRTRAASLLNPQASLALYGETPFREGKDTLGAWMERRLHPGKGEARADETVILRRLPPAESGEGVWRFFTEEEGRQAFRVHWVDLWLFPCGSGILALKLGLDRGPDEAPPGITELSRLHREVRWLGEAGARPRFWREFVLDDCLGDGACLGTKGVALDPYQRNAKLFIVAEMASLGEGTELAWTRPLMDLPVHLGAEHEERLRRGHWDPTLRAAQAAIIAGYATVRDMVLFELATVSDAGAAAGWGGDGRFRYALEYARRMVEEYFVEVWESWHAIMLRDTCAMVALDPNTPLPAQAEERYYPLCLYAYYLRYRLDRLSESLVDARLVDFFKALAAREAFLRFRNRYWFHEITTDFLGHEVFARFKAGMGVDEAFAIVQEEVDRISGYVREKYQAWTAGLISIGSVLLTVSSWPHGPLWAAGLVVAALGFILALARRASWALALREGMMSAIAALERWLLGRG